MIDDTAPLRICQLNVNKSNTAQSAFLHDITDFDVVALQEPHIDFLKNTCASYNWKVIYPTNHKDNEAMTRSIIMINTRRSTNTWTPLAVNSPDIAAVSLRTSTGIIHIYSVYNPQDSDDAQTALARLTRTALCEETDGDTRDHHILWLGDFNWHHPLWDDERNRHLFTNANLDRSERLITLLSTFDMHMLLPPSLPTLEAHRTKNYTSPDNVFASKNLVDRLTCCNVAPHL